MQFNHVFIPYGGYWSTPFARWQGNFAHLHPMVFAADIARNALREHDIALEIFDSLFLGMTIPAEHSFYGAPWLAGLIGATTISGPTINQACATSARVVGSAAYWLSRVTKRATGRISITPIHLARVAKVRMKTGYGIISILTLLLPMPCSRQRRTSPVKPESRRRSRMQLPCSAINSTSKRLKMMLHFTGAIWSRLSRSKIRQGEKS